MKCKDYADLGEAFRKGVLDGMSDPDPVFGRLYRSDDLLAKPIYSCNTKYALQPVRFTFNGKSTEAILLEDLRKLSRAIGIPVTTSWTSDGMFKIEFKNEKEINKMEAKKCDRCGKLYEQPEFDAGYMMVRFRHAFIPSYDMERYSEKKIADMQMRRVILKDKDCDRDVNGVDLCPSCIESFQRWFDCRCGEEKVCHDTENEPVKRGKK